jgi:hypothetical protein
LKGTPAPRAEPSTGHVQSSFEIIADVSCDPSLIATIGLCARVVRADRAAVLQLEKASVIQGREIGVSLESLLGALASLSGRAVPLNVSTMLRDWHGSERPPAPAASPLADLKTFRDLALAALSKS